MKCTALRWPEGVHCPNCNATNIKEREHHDRYSYRQRYECQVCNQQFDDLSETIFEGHYRPLRVWVICLYLMGPNLSNKQIAAELDVALNKAQEMARQLREGIVLKKSRLA